MRRIYDQWTRPCIWTDCPQDEDPDTCDWRVDDRRASGCPSSRSPHAIRRGAITKTLRDGTPEQVVSDRMTVSRDVIDRHYDRRTETRRDFINDA